MAQEVQTTKVTGTTLVDVKGLKVYFPIKGGIFNRTVAQLKAVDGVDPVSYTHLTLPTILRV